jgi:DNA-binding NarL/FixJ family response regulator
MFMATTKVVLLTNGSVLAAGLHQLLDRLEGVDLSVIDLDDCTLSRKIGDADPDVIVLDTGDAAAGRARVVQLLEQQPRARVVALNVHRSGIEVFRVNRVVRTDLEGLARVIEGAGRPRSRHNATKTAKEELNG